MLKAFVDRSGWWSWCTNPRGCGKVLHRANGIKDNTCSKCEWVSCISCGFVEVCVCLCVRACYDETSK